MTREAAIQLLREILAKVRPDSPDRWYRTAVEFRDARDPVFRRFRPIFSAENLDGLTVEDFRAFLNFKNNRHWEGLHRHGPEMTEDMGKLKNALRLLADDSQPIRERLDRIRPPRREPMVRWLYRAVITAILLVLYPDRYGVWNNVSEPAMRKLGLWPKMPRGASFGVRYEQMNAVLLDMAREVDVDLWTLDMLWWRIARVEPELQPSGVAPFGVEK